MTLYGSRWYNRRVANVVDRLHTEAQTCTEDPDPAVLTAVTLTLHELGLAVASATEDLMPNSKHYRQRVRLEVLAHYGGVCVCCGETNAQVLTLDHINGDGAAKRRTHGNRIEFTARAQGYPDDLQVLCQNCNWAKGTNDRCPCPDKKTVDEMLSEVPPYRGGVLHYRAGSADG